MSTPRHHAATGVEHRNFTPSAAFACNWQCGECGFQLEPQPRSQRGSSYRTAAAEGPVDARPRQRCPHCEHFVWANLREGAVVEALAERDEHRRASEGSQRSGLIKLLGLSAWTVLVPVAAWGQDTPAMLALAPVALATAWLMGHSAWTEFRAGLRPRHPNAWSHAPRPRGLRRERVQGPLQAEGQLRAPLSGRACVAYELGVRHDSHAEGDPWTWTLLEQRCARGLRVAGQELGATPYLELERQLYAGELGPQAHRQLRARGLDPERPGYTLYETVVLADQRVTLERRRRGSIIVPCTDAAG